MATGFDESQGTAGGDAGPEPAICRWRNLHGDEAKRAAEVDDIFFEASGTKSFATDAERNSFRERWLGRYLVHDADWFYVALDVEGRMAGYLAGSLDDPALTPRFADIAYFAELAPLTARYPAHLHINLAPRYRSRGWGRLLVDAFLSDLRAAGVAGVHVVTGRGLRNVRFYGSAGFREVGAVTWKGTDLVMLGCDLARS